MLVLSIMYTVFSATMGVLLIGSMGAYLTYNGTLTKTIAKTLSSLVEQLFLPSLIFTTFLKAITFQKLIILLPSILTTILCIIFGYLVGLAAYKFWIKEKSLKSIILLSAANPHNTATQLQLAYSLSLYLSQLTNKKEQEVEGELITMIILQTTTFNFFRWSIGKKILEQYEQDQEEVTIELQDLKEPSLNEINSSQKQVEQKQKQPEKSVWNGPIISIFISLACVLIYPIQNALVGDTFLHKALYMPLQTVSKPCTSVVLLMLGSNLYEIAMNNKFNYKHLATVLKIVFCRLIILPICGLLLIWLLNNLMIINDFCLLFIIYIPFCTPSAINILVMAKLYQPKAEEICSIILLYGYVMYIVTLPICLTIFIVLFLK